MDRSTPPHPDTPIPVQPLSPAPPTTKRPWSPPRLTFESTSNTANKVRSTFDHLEEEHVQGPEIVAAPRGSSSATARSGNPDAMRIGSGKR